MAVRSVRFESNFLTYKRKPKHMLRGYLQSHTCNFFLLFLFHGTGPLSSSTEAHDPRNDTGQWLLLHSPCAYRNDVKTVDGMSTLRFNQVLELTDYHILPYSRHVVITFKNLDHAYRHRLVFIS
jgi:hypothetical protein